MSFSEPTAAAKGEGLKLRKEAAEGKGSAQVESPDSGEGADLRLATVTPESAGIKVGWRLIQPEAATPTNSFTPFSLTPPTASTKPFDGAPGSGGVTSGAGASSVTPTTKSQGKRPNFNIGPGAFAAPPKLQVPGVSSDKFSYQGHHLSHGPAPIDVGGRRFVASLDEIEKLASRPVGRGIHGAVWEVKLAKADSSTRMAMKEIVLREANEASCLQIVRELDILKGGANCPFIVDFYGAFYRECTISIIMQFMDVGSFDKILKRDNVDRIPEPVVAQVAVSALGGLCFLKERLNTIHRDIKPSNMLVNSRGEIKVCDFSVSGTLHASKAKTYTGTWYYMAPERIQPDRSKQYDMRSDVWSLAVTLVELAQGSYPYPKETNVLMMLEHIVLGKTPVEREPFQSGGFSTTFQSFCECCFAKEPKDRSTHINLVDHEFVHIAVDHAVVLGWLSTIKIFGPP